MRRIICIILLFYMFDSSESIDAPVQFVPLGSRAEIPCEGYGHRRSGKWLFKRTDKFMSIVYQNTGLTFHNKTLWARKKILKNFALEISPFTELDKGTYVCQVCTSKKVCAMDKGITLLPKYDTFPPSFVIKGDQFSYSCPSNLFLKLGWRFEAHGDNGSFLQNNKLNDNSLLLIPGVRSSDAGKYSYWEKTSTGQQLRLCSVTLCVLTVSAVEWSNSAQNCTLHCDVDIDTDKRGPLIVDTEEQRISVTGGMNKSRICVNLRLQSSSVKTYTSVLDGDLTATTSYASLSTPANKAYKGPTVATLISIFIAVLFIIIPALVIVIWLLHGRKDRNSCRHCKRADRNTEGEDECSVIYSTVKVGRHQKQNVSPLDSECVYSEIKV